MRVCDIVLNSVWYDPRVKRQIKTYSECEDVSLFCVGVECKRFDAEKVNELGIDIVLIKEPQKKPPLMPGIVWRFRRRSIINKMLCNAIVAKKPDIIHANDFSALVPAYMASKKLKCKLVYDSHEIYMENKMSYNKVYLSYLKRKEKKIAKKCDIVVAVSNAAADYFAKTFGIEKPLVVTNCALKDTIIKDQTQKNQGFEVLNHGQYYSGRGYDIAIRAAELLKDYPEIKIALRGFGKMEGELREYVDTNKVENVIFYPPVTVQELIPKASHSHVGVAVTEPICLNFKLSVSNKLFEYAAAGLPVILSDIPEHRMLNDKYKFGVVLEENTPQAFAEAIKKLYLNKEFYNKCKENALAMSKEVNWENDFEKLLQKEREAVASVNK